MCRSAAQVTTARLGIGREPDGNRTIDHSPGEVVGAVGVGGGSGEQDAEIAKAGASAVSDAAGPNPSPR